MKLVLNNIRSTYNVGAILRTAEGFGIEEVILSGCTPATKYTENAPALPHVLEKTTEKIAKTALGAEELVKTTWSEDIKASLKRLKRNGFKILGLENNILDPRLLPIDLAQTVDREDLNYFPIDTNPQILVREELVLILGEEVAGISEDLYDQIDIFLEIPMKGEKESFNVSVAAGIALYELLVR